MQGEPTFETRFLALPVAARLAALDPGASRFLEASFRDRDAHLRAQACAVAPLPAFTRQLVECLEDPEVRVRVSGMRRLRGGYGESAADALTERLRHDPWPFARSAAADTLTDLPRAGATATRVDDHLEYAALHDAAPSVRRSAALALGARGATDAALTLREILEDEEEKQEVRAAAAQSLGKLCDHRALDRLTSFAVTLAYPTATSAQREIGRASLFALLRIGPSDLKARLRPFDDPEAPKASWQLLENKEAQKRCPEAP